MGGGAQKPRAIRTNKNFAEYFGPLKSQSYHDPGSNRGGSSQSLRSLSWNPLGSLVATGSSDKTLRVWNPEKPAVRYSTELKGHLAPIEQVAFNPVKEAELCSVSNDGVVKFWDVRTKTCTNEVKGLGTAFSLVWHPDGESVIVGNKADHLFILSPTQSTPLADHKQRMETNRIAFCWGGKKVFATTSTGNTRVLSYPDLKPLLLEPTARAVNHPGVGPSDEEEEKRRADDEGDGSEPGEVLLKGHTLSALSVEMSPTGRWLATGGADSIISFWDTKDWMCKQTLTGMAGPVRSMSFTFDGTYFVAGSDEGSGIDVTHVESGEKIHTFKTAGACPLVAWSPLRYCLAYSDLGMLRIIGLDADRKG